MEPVQLSRKFLTLHLPRGQQAHQNIAERFEQLRDGLEQHCVVAELAALNRVAVMDVRADGSSARVDVIAPRDLRHFASTISIE